MRKQPMSTLVLSLIVIASGAVGFQFGSPSTNDLEKLLLSQQQETRILNSQVQGLTEFIVTQDAELGVESDSEYLWVHIYVPQSEYPGDDPTDACAGNSGWEMSNFGVAPQAPSTLPVPTYGVYLGVLEYEFEDREYCALQYFFPKVEQSDHLVFGQWDTRSHPMGPIGYYWQANSAYIDWDNHSLSLNVEP